MRKHFLNFSWRKMLLITSIGLNLVDMPFVFLTIYNVIRNQVRVRAKPNPNPKPNPKPNSNPNRNPNPNPNPNQYFYLGETVLVEVEGLGLP